MDFETISRSTTLLIVLLNPFLMVIYLLDMIRWLTLSQFAWAVARGAMIAALVFALFAWAGDVIFRDVLHVRFAAFLVFGGIVFLVIGVRFMFVGKDAVQSLRGSPQNLAGAVAMPFMIGPGTINASVVAGSRSPMPGAIIAIAAALLVTVVVVIILKALHDFVSRTSEQLVERYVDMCGRISALVIGAFAVEMIFQGIEQWIHSMGTSPIANGL